MAKKMLAANWKMNKTSKEAINYCDELKKIDKNKGIDYLLAVPFTLISIVKNELKDTQVKIAAQNVSFAISGAYTGEVSVSQLIDAGADACIVGHSERRHIFNETDEQLNQKVKLLGENNIDIIFCVGETLKEREEGKTTDVLRAQLEKGLANQGAYAHLLTVAYEPVWAIGTGVNASPEDASSAVQFIKDELAGLLPDASGVRVLYGGSVTPDNTEALFADGKIDGALVGGASLDANKFVEIGKNMKCKECCCHGRG